MKALLHKIRQILRDRKARRFFTRIVSTFAALVVFVTTYAMVLPAITMEKTACCGMEEHQHNDSCYEMRLVCGQEESDGHHHDESCYEVTKELVCGLEEHQHSVENGCYDEEGNLICELQEHTHDDSCYKEVKTLTCGLEESEGHHHTDACYEKVLVCGKEAHTHSEECYKTDDSTVSATEEAAGGESAMTSGGANSADSDNADNSDHTVSEEPAEEAGAGMTDSTADASAGMTDSTADAAAGMTDSTADTAVPEDYVPALDPLNMDAMLNEHTDFYYFHAENAEEIPANSAEITDWQQVKDETELASTDLVRMHLSYSIPAGSLNETNPTAGYRLPANIHLTDEQIEAINKNENGIAVGYKDSDAEYKEYLGAEAVEGTRRPDEKLDDNAQEYISAVVKAENVYKDDRYIGQDLVFTFVPYTIEKNQNTYDADGNQLTAGKDITGWFACDFKLDQIDWIEEENQEKENQEKENQEEENQEEENQEEEKSTNQAADTDSAAEGKSAQDTSASTVEKTADIIFVSEDKAKDIEAISRTLRLIEQAENKDDENPSEEAAAEDTQEFKAGTMTADGDGYKITLDYTEEAKIPENASLSVREITADTDKEAYEACLAQAQQHMDESGEAKSSVDSNMSRFFDIEILVTDETGNTQKIEPAAPVSVNIQILDTPADTSAAESESASSKETETGKQTDPTVLHFKEEGVEQVDSTSTTTDTATENENTDSDSGSNADSGNNSDCASEGGDTTEIQFEAESFSIYGVVYTVDFHWEVNGKTYDFSLPGGGFVSLRTLMEILGVAYDETSVETSDENTENSEKNADGNKEAAEDDLIMDDVQISEKTKAFVSDIADVKFSSPELVWVGKAELDTTVGNLKESKGLTIQYSAALTKEQIEEINAQTVEAGDWALISLQPFMSEETLTITMNNGDQWAVKVTDNQAEDPLGLNGDSVVITNGDHNRSLKAQADSNAGSLQAQNPPSSDAINIWKFEYDKDAFDGAGGYYLVCVINGNNNYLRVDGNGLELVQVKPSEAEEGQEAATPFCISYDHDKMRYRISGAADGNSSFLTYVSGGANGRFSLSNTKSDNNLLAFRDPNQPTSAPGTVGTWDIKSDNIVLKLFDYEGKVSYTTKNWYGGTVYHTNENIDDAWGSDVTNQQLRDGTGINHDRSLLFSGSGLGNDEPFNNFTGDKSNGTYYSGYAYQNIVNYNLGSDGYPVLQSDKIKTGTDRSSNGSLAYLFNDSGISNAKTVHAGDNNSGLQGLLRKDSDGYYYYDSEENFAKLVGNEVILYSDTYKKNNSSSTDVKTSKIGLFPFDNYQSNQGEEKGPSGSVYDHQFGMSIATDFVYPENGIVPETNKPMTFEFSGDDDVWVFVDGVLVLDLGGVHQPISGKIDFNSGDVTITEFGSDGVEYTSSKSTNIDAMFAKASQEAGETITFDRSEYSSHKLEFFYLERGGCDSNCKIKFNLLTTKSITLEKKLDGMTAEEQENYKDQDFTFELCKKNTSSDENFALYNTNKTEETDKKVNYTVRKNAVGEVISEGFPIKNGRITLKPGETVTISKLPSTALFNVAELDQANMDGFDTPTGERYYNGELVEDIILTSSKSHYDASVNDWQTGDYAVSDTDKVVIKNKLAQNPDNPIVPDADVEVHKRIDALRDKISNPDSPHTGEDLTDLYRLYLDYKVNTLQDPKGVDLLFVIDHSGSMNNDALQIAGFGWQGNKDRAPTVQNVLNGVDEETGLIADFLAMNPNNRWAAVGFKGPETVWLSGGLIPIPVYNYQLVTSRYAPWAPTYLLDNSNAGDRDSEVLSPGGTNYTWQSEAGSISLPDEGATVLTNYTAGLWRAEQFLMQQSIKEDGKKKVVVFISDGIPTLYIDCNNSLQNAGITDGSYYYPDSAGGCMSETLTQFQNFVKDMKNYGYTFGTDKGLGTDMEFFSIGFGNSLQGGKTLLKNMIAEAYGTPHDDQFFEIGDTNGDYDAGENMRKALQSIIGKADPYTNLVIKDNLSQYVDLYGIATAGSEPSDILKAAGTKVTMTDPDDATKTITLYENGALVTDNNKTKDNVQILQSVSYDAEHKVVTATFNPEYETQQGITYTLSFDVKATDTAYETYADSGYDKAEGEDGEQHVIQGDEDTDYKGTSPVNSTSSGKDGFRSNVSAQATYVHSGKTENKDYPHPVIQVFNAPIQMLKVDQEGKPLPDAKFNLYKDAYDSSGTPAAETVNAKNLLFSGLTSTTTGEEPNQVAQIALKKLKPGTYYLVETDPPAGFNMSEPIKIEVKVNTTVSDSGTQDTVAVAASIGNTLFGNEKLYTTDDGWALKVMNTAGYELPSTGGLGTRLYTILGSILLAFAGAMLLRRRQAH